MSTMSEERQGQIALALLEHRFNRDGLRLGPSLGREMGTLGGELRDMGFAIERDELELFMQKILTKCIGSAFGYSHVSLILSDKKEKRG